MSTTALLSAELKMVVVVVDVCKCDDDDDGDELDGADEAAAW